MLIIAAYPCGANDTQGICDAKLKKQMFQERKSHLHGPVERGPFPRSPLRDAGGRGVGGVGDRCLPAQWNTNTREEED